jgi:hypothetical protein
MRKVKQVMHKHQWMGMVPCQYCRECDFEMFGPSHVMEMSKISKEVIKLRKDPSKRFEMHEAITNLDMAVGEEVR